MIKFTEILTPESLRQGVICSSKKRLFEIISELASQYLTQEDGSQCCFECLLNREKLGNSSLGNGVAMPKAKIPFGEKTVAVFLQLTDPLEYESTDNREVDLVLALLIPEKICADYVVNLPIIVEQLQDKNLCKQLRLAQSAEEIWQVFEYFDQSNAMTEDPSPEEKTESDHDKSTPNDN